jgi:GT2 family glycosyltransferase
MKIVFCIPGSSMSKNFFRCWSELLRELPSMDIEWELITEYYPYVHIVRDKIVKRALKKDYDYLMWLDNDIDFTIKDFKQLLSHSEECDIVSGVYLAQKTYGIYDIPSDFACVDIEDKRLNRFDYQGKSGLVQVRANGMGFMLVKKGVFESLENPFDMGMRKGEDIVFQTKALEKGFESYVDPSIFVGHEKTFVMR